MLLKKYNISAVFNEKKKQTQLFNWIFQVNRYLKTYERIPGPKETPLLGCLFSFKGMGTLKVEYLEQNFIYYFFLNVTQPN
jgi:hypothetical protein